MAGSGRQMQNEAYGGKLAFIVNHLALSSQILKVPLKIAREAFRYFLPYILDVIFSYLIKKISVCTFEMLTHSLLNMVYFNVSKNNSSV